MPTVWKYDDDGGHLLLKCKYVGNWLSTFDDKERRVVLVGAITQQRRDRDICISRSREEIYLCEVEVAMTLDLLLMVMLGPKKIAYCTLIFQCTDAGYIIQSSCRQWYVKETVVIMKSGQTWLSNHWRGNPRKANSVCRENVLYVASLRQ